MTFPKETFPKETFPKETFPKLTSPKDASSKIIQPKTTSICWTEKELQDLLKIGINFPINAHKVDLDSRTLEEGDIFVALQGKKSHGFEFIEDAINRGAGAIITDKEYNHPKVILVENSLDTLVAMAKYRRDHSTAKFISVTGSVGKTSTKEALNFLLSKFGKSFCNRDSFNNGTGLPVSLASLPFEAEYCVTELGMNGSGEIRKLTHIAKPEIAIITIIGQAHLENLGTIENICKAKCEIFEGLVANGTVIINFNSPLYEMQREILDNMDIKNVLTFGEAMPEYSNKPDCYLEIFEESISDKQNYANYIMFGEELKTVNHLYGKHQSVNLASILLVIKALGLDVQTAIREIPNIPRVKGRGEEYEFDINGRKINLIDDAYNANPTSMKSSLDAFTKRPGQKVIIFADMKELGENQIQLHRDLKEHIIRSGISKAFLVGESMKYLFEDISSEMESYWYLEANKESFEDMVSKLNLNNKSESSVNLGGDIITILVKGSKSTKIIDFIDFCKNEFFLSA